MMMEGEMRKINGGGWAYYVMLNELPSSSDELGENQYSEYHKVSYVAMDWTQLRRLGSPGNKPQKITPAPDAKVRFAQHSDGSGWKTDLGIGKWYAYKRRGTGGPAHSSTFRRLFRNAGFRKAANLVNNDTSYMDIPIGLKVEVRDDRLSGSGVGAKTYNGPQTKDLGPTEFNDTHCV